MVVLPGFRADDLSTFPLRSFLRGLGHEVEGWGLGRNGGHVQSLLPKVARRVRALHESGGRPVHLIGQSLGGVLAREIARDHPAAVAQVITLGTPVVGGPSYTRVAFAYDARQQERITATVEERNRLQIRVPLTVVYSRRDGIVTWEACIDHVTPRARHVEVSSSHFGMGVDPAVWKLAAELLADGH